jgi:hypothetical protein
VVILHHPIFKIVVEKKKKKKKKKKGKERKRKERALALAQKLYFILFIYPSPLEKKFQKKKQCCHCPLV